MPCICLLQRQSNQVVSVKRLNCYSVDLAGEDENETHRLAPHTARAPRLIQMEWQRVGLSKRA
jgi:hypothetical protein